MAILRTDSTCEHEDIIYNMCINSIGAYETDELTNDSKLYGVFRCGLTRNPTLRCPCYIICKEE